MFKSCRKHPRKSSRPKAWILQKLSMNENRPNQAVPEAFTCCFCESRHTTARNVSRVNITMTDDKYQQYANALDGLDQRKRSNWPAIVLPSADPQPTARWYHCGSLLSILWAHFKQWDLIRVSKAKVQQLVLAAIAAQRRQQQRGALRGQSFFELIYHQCQFNRNTKFSWRRSTRARRKTCGDEAVVKSMYEKLYFVHQILVLTEAMPIMLLHHVTKHCATIQWHYANDENKLCIPSHELLMPHLICGTNEGDIRNFIRDTKSNEVTMPRYILQIEQQLQSLLSANLTLTRSG